MRFIFGHNGSDISFELRAFDGITRKFVALIANPDDFDLINSVDKQAVKEFVQSYPEVNIDEAEFLFVHHTPNDGNPGRVVITYNPDTCETGSELRFEAFELSDLVPVPEGEVPPLTNFQEVVEYCEKILQAN